MPLNAPSPVGGFKDDLGVYDCFRIGGEVTVTGAACGGEGVSGVLGKSPCITCAVPKPV